MRYLSVGLAGAVGALTRYCLNLWITGLIPGDFPLGTLLINLSGSLLLGFVVGFGIERGRLPEPWRLPITVGLIGSYTTFSTWSVDTVLLLEGGRWELALGNVLLSLGLGLAAVWSGFWLAHRIDRQPQRSR